MKKSKRGISPVIATVLLIVIVIILALIIFLWAKGFIKENIQKKGVSADQVCNELDMEVSYNPASGELDVINKGNTPVYRLELRKAAGGSVDKQAVTEGLSAGESKTIEEVGEDYDKIEVFPVILGEVKTSKKAYVCKNSFSTA
jgi:flagellin-like protein